MGKENKGGVMAVGVLISVRCFSKEYNPNSYTE
jgi:hypothetical protein